MWNAKGVWRFAVQVAAKSPHAACAKARKRYKNGVRWLWRERLKAVPTFKRAVEKESKKR